MLNIIGKQKTGEVITYITFFLMLLITFQSCKSPDGPNEIQPGRSDYTWRADTIKILNNGLNLTRIWGITQSNVWVVGTGTSSFLSIWHYNGDRWGCDSIGRNNDPWAIIGFSSNEVWMGNTNSTIWKYDGSQWQVFGTYSDSGFDEIWIQGFDGTGSNNIYGIGSANQSYGSNYEAILMHYDGTTWKILNIPTLKVGFNECGFDRVRGNLIIEGTYYNPNGWVEKVYAWNGKKLNELYSGSTYAPVSRIQNQVYVYMNKKLYKYGNGKLVLWKDMSNTDCASKIWCGRSEDDFFMRSSMGIGHYNGTDFETVYKIYGDTDINGGCIFPNDVFFILHNYQTGVNVFVHGVLR